MYRLFCGSQNISGNKIAISDKSQLHHLKDVLRIKLKDDVVVFDDKGNEYYAFVEELLPQNLTLKVKEKIKCNPKSENPKITIACAIPKDSRMDEIIDKLTQLGVDEIIPLETERVIAKLNAHKKALREARWKKIGLSASQQSQRNTLPVIDPIKNIKDLLSQVDGYDLKLMPTLTGERQTLREVFAKTQAKNILVLIGPEGDFSPFEINSAKKAGFILVSLGKLTLRVETAAVAVASFMRLYAEPDH